MADFDLEQLKTLFENLGDRLDKTQGDKFTKEELSKIRQLMAGMSNKIGKAPAGSDKPSDPKEFIDQFWRQWKTNDPMAPLINRLGNQKKGTLIDEFKGKKDNGAVDLLRKRAERDASGSFVKNVDEMGKKTKEATTGLGGFINSLKKGGVLATIGAAGTSALGKVSDNADNYKELLSSSEGSIQSYNQFTNAANSATMSTKELAAAMTEGTTSARKMGAIKWTQVTAAFTKATQGVGNMGLSFKMQQDAIGTFTDILGKQGNLGRLNENQMVNGIEQLVNSSADTAHILGLTRKDALEAAREAASQHDLNAIVRAMGIKQDSYAMANKTVGETMGPQAQAALKEILANGQVTSKASANWAAVNTDQAQLVNKWAATLRAGQDLDSQQVAKDSNAVSERLRNDPNQVARARLSIGGADSIDATTQASLGSSFQGADSQLNESKRATGTDDAGSRVVLDIEQVQRAKMAVLNQAFDTLTNTILNTYGKKIEELINWTLKAASSLVKFIQSLEGMSGVASTIGTLGLAAFGLSAAFNILSGGVKMITGLFDGLGSIINLFKGGGAAAGAAQGAAGAAGAAEAGAAGAAGAGGLAAGALALAAAGVAAGGLGLLAGGKQVQNRKDESFFGQGKNEKGVIGSRATGYGTSAAGGALAGAAIGSVVPVVGTAIGAGLGALGGLGYAWWNDDGTGDQPANASQNGKGKGPRAPQANRQQPANASKAPAKNALSMDQMTQRLMESNERAAAHLKAIKENSDKHSDLLREEIIAIRTGHDRLARLLEDGNKNTRSIAEHSA